MKQASSPANNIETVQNIYTAFSRGDIPAILNHLAEDVVWEYGVHSTDVPWLQPRRGRTEVNGFFEALQAVDISRFEPKRFFESGPVVVVLIDLEGTVKATGRRVVEEDEVHIWHFNEQGRVARFRHRADTHQHMRAFHQF